MFESITVTVVLVSIIVPSFKMQSYACYMCMLFAFVFFTIFKTVLAYAVGKRRQNIFM